MHRAPQVTNSRVHVTKPSEKYLGISKFIAEHATDLSYDSAKERDFLFLAREIVNKKEAAHKKKHTNLNLKLKSFYFRRSAFKKLGNAHFSRRHLFFSPPSASVQMPFYGRK